MKAQFLSLFKNYWVEILVIPPFLVLLCFYLYGGVYLSSWYNFWRMTFPWFFISILSPIACHWVRDETLRHFSRLDDWPKRVVWNIVGYMLFTVGFSCITYFVLAKLQYADLVPSQDNFIGLLVIAAMCVLISATMYEGITYFEKWKEAVSETEQLEKLNLESQFQSLQSQLNPHFLFNSFNVLSSLITENPRRAEDFVDELSNVYRYLLRSNDRELVTVAEELRFIRSFFHLLATRYDAGILLNINVAPGHLDKKLPALALQILVENVVKHNEISVENPLTIEIYSQQSKSPASTKMPEGDFSCQIVVQNNIQRKATRPPSNRVGIENLRQRYELLNVTGFNVNSDGQLFSVVLPVL